MPNEERRARVKASKAMLNAFNALCRSKKAYDKKWEAFHKTQVAYREAFGLGRIKEDKDHA